MDTQTKIGAITTKSNMEKLVVLSQTTFNEAVLAEKSSNSLLEEYKQIVKEYEEIVAKKGL